METGIVGFFDILGYQNIINNNEIEKIADIISGVILNLPQKVQSTQTGIFERLADKNNNKSDNKFIHEIINQIDFLIISDSILITLPIEDNNYDRQGAYYWMVFLMYSCLLLEESFNSGLPLRGAIDFGQYYKKENCIAGKTIINGYILSNQLEFSGCILCENASKQINNYNDSSLYDMLSPFIVQYLVPLKNNIEKKSHLLNWVAPRTKQELFDPKQYTIEAFHDHNKDIPINTFQKVNNTENIIRYCLMINESRNKKKT